MLHFNVRYPVVLHGLRLPTDTIKYLKKLPATVRFLKLAMNAMTDEEMAPLSTAIAPGMKQMNGNLQKVTRNTSGRAGKIWLI